MRRIIVSTHGENLRLYNSNVDRFLQEAKANEELPFGGLGIQSLNSTAPPSRTQTPSQDPIRLAPNLACQLINRFPQKIVPANILLGVCR
jgi:hypothetical protein